MEEAVAISAQVAADVAQDDGRGLTVVVVVAHGLQVRDRDIKRLFCLIGSRMRLLTLFEGCSPFASAVRLCPSSAQRTVCQHGPGPARRVRPKPATAIDTVGQNAGDS